MLQLLPAYYMLHWIVIYLIITNGKLIRYLHLNLTRIILLKYVFSSRIFVCLSIIMRKVFIIEVQMEQ